MDSQGSNKNPEIIEIEITQLQVNPTQPRGIISPESIMELADSIREHGVLEPLVVAHTPAGYQLIAGERRWRASKLAGLKKVPCIVKETNPRGMLEMTLVENVQREDLNPLEKAKAFKRLKDEFGLGTNEIGRRIGKSPSYISNTLRLLDLPDAIKDGMLSGLITEGHARALQTINDPKLMIEAYKMVLRESASVRKTEEFSKRIRIKVLGAKKHYSKANKNEIIISEEIDRMQDGLKKALGDNSRVRLLRTRRQTRINITLIGDVEETEEKLQELYRRIINA